VRKEKERKQGEEVQAVHNATSKNFIWLRRIWYALRSLRLRGSDGGSHACPAVGLDKYHVAYVSSISL
jgi:hypothetical protein